MSIKVKPPKIPDNPRRRRWAAAVGGCRLSRLKSALVGYRNGVLSLPSTDPRRTPSLPHVKFLEVEEQASAS